MIVVFGVIGYTFNKLSYSLPPLILALVLGDLAGACSEAMLLSQGASSIFWSNALVGSIVGLGIVLLCWPMIGLARSDVRGRGRATRRST